MHARDERGAVAVLTAMVAVSLLVICALVVDLGLARDTKRDSQNAADASALAAANALWPGTATCLDGSTTPPCYADAVVKAKNYAAVNFGVTESDWSGCSDGSHFYVPSGTPQCISFTDSSLTASQPVEPTRVRVVVPTETVTTGFGTLADVNSIPIGTFAEAGVDKEAVGGLRPWGICSAVANITGNVTFVPMFGGSTTTQNSTDLCGAKRPPGGWWVMQCTGQGNGDGITEDIVESGCPTTGYHAVPGQPTGNPTTVLNFLKGACPNKTENDTCLASDNGHNFHNTSDEWQPLVGQTFTMPVMCALPNCSDLAVSGNGQNASYAIYKMATVELCGFSFINGSSLPSTDWPTSGPCATNNPVGYKSSDVKTGAGFFMVIKAIHGGGVDWDMPGQVSPPNLVR